MTTAISLVRTLREYPILYSCLMPTAEKLRNQAVSNERKWERGSEVRRRKMDMESEMVIHKFLIFSKGVIIAVLTRIQILSFLSSFSFFLSLSLSYFRVSYYSLKLNLAKFNSLRTIVLIATVVINVPREFWMYGGQSHFSKRALKISEDRTRNFSSYRFFLPRV